MDAVLAEALATARDLVGLSQDQEADGAGRTHELGELLDKLALVAGLWGGRGGGVCGHVGSRRRRRVGGGRGCLCSVVDEPLPLLDVVRREGRGDATRFLRGLTQVPLSCPGNPGR